jgi:hypothetical protein
MRDHELVTEDDIEDSIADELANLRALADISDDID